MKTISIVVPCYNEEQVLPIFISSLDSIVADLRYNWEVLLINDGSTDNTLTIMQKAHENDKRVSYIELSRNFGKEAAMLAGFDFAQGDAVVVIDADMQDPPSLIPQMIAKWEDGYDDVYARRQTRGKESWLRSQLTKTYYRLLSRSTQTNVLPNVGDFRLLDRQCIDALRTMREQGRYTKGLFCYIGYKKTEVLFDRKDRVAGDSKMSYRSLFHLAAEGLLSSTTIPLRIASIVGLVVSIFAFLYAVWILIKTLIWGDPVAGFPTLIVVILFLGGVQLLSIGIIGEYLGRVYQESKHRPVYFARTFNGKKIN